MTVPSMHENTKHTILILGASPKDAARPGLTREYQAIDAQLRNSDRRDDFELRPAWESGAAALPGLILRYRPEILHFSGHGSDKGELIFEGADGKGRPADKKTVAEVFGVFAGTVRCVVLNACYSESQALLIAQHVDVVIGMRGALRVQSAIAFSAGFYEALGYGCSFAKAFELAKLRIDLEALPDIERPVMHIKEGVDAETVGLPELTPAPAEAPAVSEPQPTPAWSHAGTVVVAAALLASSILVFVFAPDRLPDYKMQMVRHLVALAAGVGVAFLSGYLTVRMKAGGWAIQAGGGFAAWLITLLTWGAASAGDETHAQAEPPVRTETSEKPSTGEPVQPVRDDAALEGTDTSSGGGSEDPGTETGSERGADPKPRIRKTWTVTRVRSVQDGDNKRIELEGPGLPSSGILRLSKPVADGRSFVSNVDCRISGGLPPWCMLVHKPGNDGLVDGDKLEMVGGTR